MQMQAARWHGQKDVRIETVEVPTPKAHEVKIEVAYAGICGTDLHEYLAGPIFIPTKPHPLSKCKAPVTLGHEFCGRVVEVGTDVTDVAIGDRVVVEPIWAKNDLLGKYNLDPDLGFIGLASDGGFAPYCVVKAALCHKLPDGIDFEQAALIEPAAVALYAVRQSKLKAGDTAAVFGCGPIGLLTIEALKAAGAARIFAVEVSKVRQQKARDMGAIVLDPTQVDVVDAIREQSAGGADVSFEVTGIDQVLGNAIACVQNDGECVIVSIWEGEATITPNELVIKEKTVKGIIAYRHIFPAVIALMQQGYFAKEDLVTKKIALKDIVQEGFEALANDKSQVKILVSP